MFIVLLLLLPGVRVEETTSSKLLSPKNLNHFQRVQFVKANKLLQKGPILFPNDGPSSPPTPLIVTSRPLIESILRSELNPNNSVQIQSQAQSQIDSITYRPAYLARSPYGFELATVTPNYEFASLPYDKEKQENEDNYDDYDAKNSVHVVVPIYKSMKDSAMQIYQQKATVSPIHRGLTDAKIKPFYNYLQKPNPDYASFQVQPNNKVEEETSKDYNTGENFAFSYTVKDQETGDDFSHSQQSSGSTTNGEYRVVLPDGRTQIVSYTADENGYKADVRYDEHKESNRPTGHLDLKPIKEKQDDSFHSKFYEHRVDDGDRIPGQYNKQLYKFGDVDNIYFDYGDKGSRHRDERKGFLNPDPNDYLDLNNVKVNLDKKRNHDDYYHYGDDTDVSRDYKDYSSETEYLPYKSKFAAFTPTGTNNNEGVKSTVKPSYEELKGLFVTKLFQNPQNALSSTVGPMYDTETLNGQYVSSTIRPYDQTTENVVIIGTRKPSLFTNIKNILSASSVAPSLLTYPTPSPVISTPSSYLYSTIANLKKRISESSSPQFTTAYIDKITKYISTM